MSLIVGIMGMSRVGKDVVGEVLTENGFKRYAFGDLVKNQYAEENNLPIEEMYNERKNFHRPGIIDHGEKKRINNPFYWIDAIKNDMLNDFKNGQPIVITDIRRIPELKFIKSLKDSFGPMINLVEVIRPLDNGGIFDEDAETSHAIVYAQYHHLVDITLYNISTKTAFYAKAENLLGALKNRML